MRHYLISRRLSAELRERLRHFCRSIKNNIIMNPTPILYTMGFCPAGRAVQLTARYIGLKLDCRNVDVNRGEHLTDEFLKVSIDQNDYLIHTFEL